MLGRNCRLTWNCLNSAPVCYRYVRMKDIETIRVGYGDGLLDKSRMYGKIFMYIGKQAFKSLRADFHTFRELRSKPREQLTHDDWNELIRLHHDFWRLGPLIIIQILPMSGPLFFLYMYTYPGSIPSWFMIDKYHEEHERRIRVVQQTAVEYFKSKNIPASQINFDQMTLQEARKLAECLYGYHRDGTIGYRKLFKKEIPYVISEGFSKYLIKRKLRYKFNADLEHTQILDKLTFDEKIRWKYNEVIEKGNLLKKYQDTLSPAELKAREESEAAQNSMEGEGNHNTKKQ